MKGRPWIWLALLFVLPLFAFFALHLASQRAHYRPVPLESTPESLHHP